MVTKQLKNTLFPHFFLHFWFPCWNIFLCFLFFCIFIFFFKKENINIDSIKFINDFEMSAFVARVRHRGDRPPHSIMRIYLVNVGRQGILVSYQWKKWNGSRHLVLWSLGTLTGLRDRVRRLVAQREGISTPNTPYLR